MQTLIAFLRAVNVGGTGGMPVPVAPLTSQAKRDAIDAAAKAKKKGGGKKAYFCLAL